MLMKKTITEGLLKMILNYQEAAITTRFIAAEIHCF